MRRRRTPLNRERVLRAAVALADEQGLTALSMRRLGQQLGVEAMSLYNHVANKDDLLDGITDLVLRDIELPGDDVHWKTALRENAISAHDVLRRHPWACKLVLSSSRPLPVAIRRADWMLRRLREGGLSPEVTFHAYHALDAHILGFTLWQLGHGIADEQHLAELAANFFRQFPLDDYPYMREHAEQHLNGFGRGEEGAFERVLDLILNGLEELG